MYVRLLGQVAAGDDRSAVRPVAGAVPAAVLAHLSLAQGRVMPIDELARRVWDEPPANPRNALQAAVMRLRRTCPPATVLTGPDGYRISAVARFDVEEATRGLDAAQRVLIPSPGLAAARAADVLGLFDGEPLAGLRSLASSTARAALDELRTTALLLRSDALVLDDRAALAVPDLRDAVSSHPLSEPLHAALIRVLAAAGRPAEALEHAARVRVLLGDELGVDPSAEIAEAFETVLAGSAVEELVLRRARGRSPRASRVVLPESPAALLGRHDEVAQLEALMTDHRLVTVTGLGGVGKTALVVAHARACAASTFLNVAFVDASELRTRGALVREVARALGSNAAEGDDVEALSVIVGDQPALLVLDDCRGTAVADDVAVLLAALPGLHVVATSREPLHAPHEALVPLLGLDVPAATQLLRIRARELGVDIEEVAEADQLRLVRCVDGVPLALELLAARVASSGARALLDELGASPSGPARVLGMGEVVDASSRQLDDAAAALLVHLAELPDGLSRELAASLLAADPDEALRALAAAGLAVRTWSNPPRWVAPDMVRDHVRSAADHERGRRAVAVLTHYASVQAHRLHGIEAISSLEPPCVQERGNLVRAWRHRDRGIDSEVETRALLLLAAVDVYLDLTEPALAQDCDEQRSTSSGALAGWLDMVVARHLHRIGEQDAAIARAWTAVHPAREVGDRQLESVCLRGIAHGLLMLDRAEDALELASEAAALAAEIVRVAPDRVDARKIGAEARRIVAACLCDCGRPDVDVAAEYEAALVEARALGRPQLVLPDLATWAAEAGLTFVAARAIDELRRCCRPDETYDLAHADVADALLARRRGDTDALELHAVDALLRFRASGDLRWVGSCVWMLAEGAVLRGDPRTAAVLLGVRLSVVPDPVGEPEAVLLERRLRAELGADPLDALVDEGRILGLDGALRLVASG